MKTKIQIIVIILVLLSGFFFYHFNRESYDFAQELESLDTNSQTKEKVSPLNYFFPFLKSSLQKKIEKGEKVNFLLLGYGGEGHSGAYLTDTIILGQMDFGSSQLTLMNIPRDLAINGQKINELYNTYKDGRQVSNEIEEILGLNIDYFLTLDFDGFREAVDKMGGLEIYVETTFDDYNYPRNDNDQIDAGVMSLHFDAGWETMDGERALQYARSRYSNEDGGDFNRSKRQQKVIQAFKEKILETKNLKILFEVIKTLQSHFQTDFPYVDLLGVYNYSQKQEITFTSKILSEENYLYSSYNAIGQYILLPLNDDWQSIKDYFESTQTE